MIRASSVILGTISVVESGYSVYSQLKKKGPLTKEEKTRLVAELIFAILQTTTLTIGVIRACLPDRANTHLFKALGLITTGATGVAHIGKVALPMVMKKGSMTEEDWLNVLGVVVYRLEETASSSNSISSEVGTSLEVLGTSIVIYSKRDEFKTAGHVVMKWINQQLVYRRVTNGKPVPMPEPVPIVVLPNTERFIRLIEDFIDKVQGGTLEEIPDLIAPDPLLREFKCQHSGKCIRHICRPSTAPADVYYERRNIDHMLNSSETPRGWPDDLRFTSNHVVGDRSLQELIDRRLTELAEEWSQRVD